MIFTSVSALAVAAITAIAATGVQQRLLPASPDQKAPAMPAQVAKDLAGYKAGSMRVLDEPEYSDNLETLLSEDFAKFEEGTEQERYEEALAGPGQWEIDSRFTTMPGWTGYGIYQAGGTCAIDYPGFGGVLNTPTMNLTGKVIVRFRARPIRPEDTWHGLIVTLLTNPLSPSYADEDCFRYAQLNSPDWKTFEFVYENTNIDDCFIQFNDGVDRTDEPERLGILIDDIQILRDADYVPSPSGMTASDFKKDSFMLSWNEVSGADSYKVEIFKEEVSTDPAVYVNENFNGFDAENPQWPEGWNPVFSENPIVEGGTDGSLGMAFRTGDDEVDFPSDGISRVVYFACTVYPGKINTDTEAILYVFGHSPEWDHWGWLKQVDMSEVPESGLRIEMTGDADALWENDAMNISFKGAAEGEYAIVDDVEVKFEPARKLVSQWVKNTTGTSMLIDGLDPEADYYYSLKAVKGDKESFATEAIKAFGVSTPMLKEATDVDRRGAFTANWEKTPKATGYIVNLYQSRRVLEDCENYAVLEEDFENPKTEVTATPEDYEWVPGYDQYLYFDDYTETPGWHSDGAAVCKGMIGCGSSSYAFFNLYSPYMTLSNDNGKFTVEATVWSEAGETFAIQTETQYGKVEFTEAGKMKLKAEFQNGKPQQRLMMYTVNGAPFFLDDFKVTQNLKKDDLIHEGISQNLIEDGATSIRFSGLETGADILYSYNVQALRVVRKESCSSAVSGMQLVDLNGTLVDATEADNAIVTVDGRDIVVACAAAVDVEVFNIQGMKVASAAASDSETVRFAMPDSGIYIVRVGNAAFKVIIR